MLRGFLAKVVRTKILGQVGVQYIRRILTKGTYVGGLQNAKYNREDVIRARARLYGFFLSTLRILSELRSHWRA